MKMELKSTPHLESQRDEIGTCQKTKEKTRQFDGDKEWSVGAVLGLVLE